MGEPYCEDHNYASHGRLLWGAVLWCEQCCASTAHAVEINRGAMEIDVATAWEIVSDTLGDQDAIVQGDRRISYNEFDSSAAQLATALAEAGVSPGAKVALYLYNSPEYLIGEYGAFKNRNVPINVNYRYLDDELAYLIENSDAEAIIFHSSLGERVGRIRDRVPSVRLFVEVNDDGPHLEGAEPFNDLLAASLPQARQTRSAQDLYMMYTGGTTGMPKGVMSRQGSYIAGVYAGGTLISPNIAPPTERDEIAPFVTYMSAHERTVSVPCCPLMHATGLGVGAIPALTRGGTVVLLENNHFDAHELWQTTEREGVTHIVIVGDPFARPMARALEERVAQGTPYDTSSVKAILSAGTIWSTEIKELLGARTEAVMFDLLGSTEGGIYALSSASSNAKVATAQFTMSAGTRVVTEAGIDVVPGSGEAGLLATESRTFGYYKDPEKTARTFREMDGKSYVLTGDWATVEVNGVITLLGRGSNCINTGGEKVFPEEVEEAVKRHPGVDDCLVVGVPDERFGQAIAAVVGSSRQIPPTGEEIREWLRTNLSHFKVPRSIVVISAVRRAPNGKADYDWAKETLAAHDANA